MGITQSRTRAVAAAQLYQVSQEAAETGYCAHPAAQEKNFRDNLSLVNPALGCTAQLCWMAAASSPHPSCVTGSCRSPEHSPRALQTQAIPASFCLPMPNAADQRWDQDHTPAKTSVEGNDLTLTTNRSKTDFIDCHFPSKGSV